MGSLGLRVGGLGPRALGLGSVIFVYGFATFIGSKYLGGTIVTLVNIQEADICVQNPQPTTSVCVCVCVCMYEPDGYSEDASCTVCGCTVSHDARASLFFLFFLLGGEGLHG